MYKTTAGGPSERHAFILFTDIHRSTQLWEKFPDEFGKALERHNALVEQTVLGHGGEIMKNLGDGYIAIFEDADECVRSGVEIRKKLEIFDPLPDGSEIAVRIVGHSGPLQPLAAGRGYFGRPLNRASRICQVCNPGQVLISEPVLKAMREPPEECESIDLGSHLLRDLNEPERIYQLFHPSFRERDFPALRSLSTKRHNLPIQPDPFVGRWRQLKELRRLLLDGKRRLITLTGPGGYGKTRLAIQLCAELVPHYEQGAYLVALEPVLGPERLVSATATAFDFQFYGRGDPKRQLLDYLREKEMLILFDNFEHLLPGRDFVGEILKTAPQVSILVTSREPLRLKAEQVYSVEPLSLSDGVADEAAASGYPEATELFIERARAVNFALPLTSDNLLKIGEISNCLEGIPLPIEMAAAWADTLSLEEILAQVKRYVELTMRLVDVPVRHRSVRASLDWSFGLLSEELRSALIRLSVFKGGFFGEAASEVLEIGNILAILSELALKNWLRPGETLGKSRFSIGAAEREYLLEKLRRSTLWEETVVRHSNYFGTLLEREGERLKGHGQLEALRTLNLELENIYEGLDTLLNGRDSEALALYAKYLADLLEITSRWLDGIPWYEQIIKAAEEAENNLIKMIGFLGLGRLLFRLGRYEEAEKKLQESRCIAHEEKDGNAFAWSTHNLGNVAYSQGRYDEAERLYRGSLEMFREIGDRLGISSSLSNQGNLALIQGKKDEAERLYKESFEMSKEISDRPGISIYLKNLGVVAHGQGRYNEAEKLHNKSLEMFREASDRRGISGSLNNLGNVALSQGRYDEAQKLYKESLEISKETGYRLGTSWALRNLGNVAYSQGRYDKAERLYKESFEMFMEIGDRWGISYSLYNLGNLALSQGRYDEAQKLYKESLEIRKEIGNGPGIAESQNILAMLMMRVGLKEEAYTHLIEALRISQEVDEVEIMLQGLVVAGDLLVNDERPREAAILPVGAAYHAEEIGYKLPPIEQELLNETMEKLETLPSPEELEEARSAAEKMTLADLIAFALNLLEELS